MIASIHIISHEQVIGVWAIPSYSEKLQKVLKLAVNVSTDCHRALHWLNIGLFLQTPRQSVRIILAGRQSQPHHHHSLHGVHASKDSLYLPAAESLGFGWAGQENCLLWITLGLAEDQELMLFGCGCNITRSFCVFLQYFARLKLTWQPRARI